MIATTTLNSLPGPVIQIIFGHLNAKDRSQFAMTCKRIYRAFLHGIRYLRVEDHRPYLQTIRAKNKTHCLLEGYQKIICVGKIALLVSLGSCCVGGVLMPVSTGCHGACTVSASASKILLNTGLYLFSFGGCLASIVCAACCKKKEQSETYRLEQEYDEKEQELEQHRNILQINTPPPQIIHMEETSYTSYQRGDSIFLI